MAVYGGRQFLVCLQKPSELRTTKDLDVLFSYLHGMEALASLREPALRALCRTVRYEYHEANDILYCQGELSTCWYILLSGSVFIEGSMFLPRSSFGKRTAGCARRPSECLILEPSEMMVIDYPDVHVMKSGARHPNAATMDRLIMLEQEDTNMRVRRMHSDGCTDQLQYPQDVAGMFPRDPFLRNEQYFKRSSRASDTSSAYSGSDMMQSSIDDQDNGDIDLSGLMESVVDSDEEEGYAESTESVRDGVRECLEKDAAERTEDDIEILLEFMQHFPAFANMTLATRRALCAVMVYAVVEKEGTIVMNDGEELDSWSVVLNGLVQITRPDSSIEQLHMGDSFGITPTMEKLYHRGVMRTMVDDCQFVCIAQSDYYRILHQGEENTKKHEEDGKVVMVTEHRVLDGGNRRGHIVIRGTPERLMQHLVEDHSVIDPTYVEDFLLSYRTFLASPQELASKLLLWFQDPMLRSKVTRVVLLWVNNHFNDFETDAGMCDFLEKFEELLEGERMGGQLRLLNIACAAKARPRTVTLTRATREEIMHFSILGGLERGCGIFVTKVERGSKAYEAGLKRGDQILEVNGVNFETISHTRALEVLRGTTHLSVTVKSNLLAFKEMLQVPDRSSRKGKKDEIAKLQTDPKQRLSAPDLEAAAVPPVITITKDKKSDKKDTKSFMAFGNKTKLRKALMKMNIIPRNMSSDSPHNNSDENLYVRPSRKSSTSSASSGQTMSNHLSASNPDLSTSGLGVDDLRSEFHEHVLKIYRADQSFKYLLVHKETTAREVVMLALREFGITDPSNNYSLCEVTVENESIIKQKRLPDQLANLPDRVSLNGRYCLKNNMCTETLVPDEVMGDLIKDSQISLLQLNTAELASQLTLEDFKVFRDIEQTEYIDDLFDLKSKFSCPNLVKFAELVNREMWWVVTEVCNESNIVKRMKLIKHFIKIARHCKDCKNFNSMFAILSGLGHGSVSRLRNTWEKLPGKYMKMFEDLQDYMDPSRNMSKYRNLIASEHAQPPMLPFFPVVKKDLTFIHLGNDSFVDSLVNFEKLRMIAKEIRHICNMCSARYDVSTMYLGTPSFYESSTVSGVATMKRSKNRRGSTLPNAKKMYEEALMVRRVKSYLTNIPVIADEEELKEMSSKCEPSATRKRDPSPVVNTNHVAEKQTSLGPKFGAASPEAVRKLMSLTDKVRPHNPKHPMPPVGSPFQGRRPTSPRYSNSRPLAVHLSPESSSVVSLSNLGFRKPSRTASMGSSESASPTSSVSNYPQHYETDSGHASIGSSNFDSRSTSSIGSANSPPSSRRPYHPPHPAHSQYSQQAHTNTRRPPLPDYHSATQMAQLARQKHGWQMERAHSHEGVIGYYQGVDDEEYDVAEEDEVDEEQVSAV
ncbi:rap guanine nucleotide exchange factor 6-like isoform X3 [Liolophura sinensis]|uniref:rap guanine nucleotide exchange factor 6-like isoform X3 n=1 Tax=Liolophura sinensis TaxID=3198878 RepID=UPI0031583DA7